MMVFENRLERVIIIMQEGLFKLHKKQAIGGIKCYYDKNKMAVYGWFKL